MSLPSQSARPIARRNHMYRRSRRRRPPAALFVFIALVVIVAVGYVLWPDSGGTEPGEPAGAGQGNLAMNPATSGIDAPRPYTDEGTPAERSPARGQPRQPDSAPAGRLEMGTPIPAPVTTPPATEPRETERDATSAPGTEISAPGSAGSISASGEARQRAAQRMDAGLDLLRRNDPFGGRTLLSQALETDALDPAAAARVRAALTELNERLVFSPEVFPDDPFVVTYIVQSGDALSRIPRKMGVHADWRFIQRINRISRPERIRPPQRLKLVTGPFHAVIYKHAYRMDLYLGNEADRVYVRSFPVGLGEFNLTPVGRFRVRPNSKLINPEWPNPRSGRVFAPDDPENPIGEHWIGLIGDEEQNDGLLGYGIHGTIEPETIGTQASMGCVRMLPDDIALLWELLMDDVSTVDIRP